MVLIGRLIRTYLTPHIGILMLVFIIVAAVSAMPYGFSFLGKWLVDDVLQVTGPPKPKAPVESTEESASVSVEWTPKTTEEKLRLLGIFFAISIGAHVVVTGLSALSELIKSRLNNGMIYALRTALHDKIEHMEMAFFAREQVGQFMTRVFDDAAGIPGNLTQLVINFFTQLAMLILGAVLLFRLNPSMAPIALAVLPFYAVTCIVFLPKIKRNTEELRVKVAELAGFVIERLSNVATIKNYAQEDREREAFGQRVDRNIGLNRRQHRLNLFFGTLTTIITGIGTLAVLFLGFLNIKAQRMQLGEVLAFYQVTAQLFVPVSALVGLASVAQTLQVLASRVYSVFDSHATLADAPDAVAPGEIRGEISFEHVSLRYEEGGPFAVEDINLSIPAGETVCIVGPTGCGKSTLLVLLTRLYDPTEGAMRIDGVDLRKLPVQTLRRAVGNVLHTTRVFSGTIGENIAYGVPDESPEEIEETARLVGLHDFIQSQPHGYKTRLGKGGITLSTEQLVQLALARALVTKPAILTVDDTYATIEEEVEERLRAVVRGVLVDRTILIATSRLSICEDADRVVVMQRGKVVQVGTHEELLAVPGLYRRMYMLQMGLQELDAALSDQKDPVAGPSALLQETTPGDEAEPGGRG